jgi:AAA domain/DnaB-like helicase N terminal domain
MSAPPSPDAGREVILEAERAVIGALMSGAQVPDGLKPTMFSLDAHARMFEGIANLTKRGEKVDFVALTAEMLRLGTLEAAGGRSGLSAILEGYANPANVTAHSKIVRTAWLRCELRRAALKIAQKCDDETSPFASIIDRANRKLIELAAEHEGGNGARVTCAADVEPQAINWLWPGRIPLGMISELIGDSGLGKSTVCVDLSARLSRGNVMPDGAQGPAAAGVVIMSGEDDWARVIVPRLRVAGADLNRIIHVEIEAEDGPREPSICGADLLHVERAMLDVGAKLLWIDPVMEYLPSNVDAHRDQDVRRTLGALNRMAERTGAAVLLVRHLNKNVGGAPLHRGGGSVAFTAAARSGMTLAPDPDATDAEGGPRPLVLAMTKANLAPPVPTLKLHLEAGPEEKYAHVQWDGTSEHTAATALAVPRDPDELIARDDAAEFLRDLLGAGPMEANEAKRKGREAGITDKTLRRAREKLGVKPYRVGQPGGGGHWMWSLSTKVPSTHPSNIERQDGQDRQDRRVDEEQAAEGARDAHVAHEGNDGHFGLGHEQMALLDAYGWEPTATPRTPKGDAS